MSRLRDSCNKHRKVEKIKAKYNYYSQSELTKGQEKMIRQREQWAKK